MNSKKQINAPSRDAALDATRTMAILLMIACHVARLIPKSYYTLRDATQYTFIGLKKTFTGADLDKNGYLNQKELANLLSESTPEQIETLFTAIDTSKHKPLSYSEFFYAMEKASLRPSWQQFCLDIEPLCQGLFLSMVGVSLVYSMRIAKKKGEPSWGGRQFRRAIELYIIGMVFFLFQFGWQWPWTFIGNGILLTISMSILFWLPLVRKDIGLYISLAILGILTALNFYLDYNEYHFAFVNGGNGPIFSHILLSSFGVVCAYILLDGTKVIKSIFLLIMVGCIVFSLNQESFMMLFDYPFGRQDYQVMYQQAGNGPEQIWKLITGGELIEKEKEYYNYRPGLAPMLMALCTGIYLIFKLLGPITQKLKHVWLVGKHSLGVYILHLILIALTTVIFGSQKPFETKWEVNTSFVIITLLCYGYAFYKKRRSTQKNAPSKIAT